MGRRLILALVLLFLYCHEAASVDPSLFGGLNWRLIGPFRGGRVLAVTGVAGEPDHFYFGAVNGGVWETNDAGRTWSPIFDDIPIASIGAIAIAPSNPKIIYVGTGEADMRSDIGYGNGMYKSIDGGKKWMHLGLENTHQIGKILVDAKNPDLLYVAALGHAYGPNQERGVFRSSDGGRTWQRVLYKDENTGAVDLAYGADAGTIYASLWRTRRPPWNVYPPSKGPGSGLFKSTDSGNTWNEIKGNGFPAGGVGRIGIAVAPSDPRIIYALLDATNGGLYRSDDAGLHWAYVSADKRIWQRGWYFEALSVDPKNADVVYACNVTMYKSTDGGKTFIPFRGAPGGDDYHALWIDPENPDRMITGADQGAVITLNGGQSWSSWYNQPTGQFYHMTTDDAFPYRVYGTQQDSGAASVPSRTLSPYDGITLMHFDEIRAGDENGYIAPDPVNPNLVYGGSVEKTDRSTEQTTNVDPTLAYPDVYRSEWTLPLTFSPRNPKILYFANQYLFRTADGGKHWDRVSDDLTRDELIIPPNLDPITAQHSQAKGEKRAVIYAIAPSPLRDGTIWAGTDDGLVWLTEDEGAHWKNITPKELAPWSKVAIIETSHFDVNTAYLAVDRHRVDDYRPHIYRTRDAGKSWTPISNGIPDGHFVNVVREDPQKKGLLFAGTELDLFVSFDDGDHWQSLQLNLPPSSIRDIDIHDDDLVAATHGRAFWILDDISRLRQLNEETAKTEIVLFKPAIAYRIHSSGFTGTPFPKDEPAAANPPFGAKIDYYVNTNITGAMLLEILNDRNQVVRTYSSADAPLKPDLQKIKVTADWFPSQSILSTEKGGHRFVWDLHHSVPDALKEESTDGTQVQGPWAVPGSYQIRLTINGKKYNQPLLVKNDPRVNVTQQDLLRQLEFARKIEAERVRIVKISNEVKSLLQKAGELRKKSQSELAAKLTAFEADVMDSTELRAEPAEIGTPDYFSKKTTSLLYLANSFKSLQQTVSDSAGAPSVDALNGFEKQHASLEKTLQEWNDLKSRWLSDLNAALQRESLPVLPNVVP